MADNAIGGMRVVAEPNDDASHVKVDDGLQLNEKCPCHKVSFYQLDFVDSVALSIGQIAVALLTVKFL